MKDAKSVFRANALLDSVFGLFLLAASWDDLYQAFELPAGKPAFYAQLAGGVLLGWAYLLWTGSEPPWRRRLAGLTALVNVAGAALIVVWLISGRLNEEAVGTTVLALVAAALTVLALAEAAIARREQG